MTPASSNGDSQQPRVRRLAAVVLLAAGAAALYVGLEWLFFVTKPSFMSGISWTARTSAGVHVFALVFLLLVSVSAPILLLGGRRPRPGLTLWPARLAIALVVACALLLEADVFMSTLFRRGLAAVQGPGLFAFSLLFLGTFLLAFLRVGTWEQRLASRRLAGVAAGLVVAAGALLAAGLLAPGRSWSEAPAQASGTRKLPNILLLGADGVDAARMSVYGAGRATTPFTDKLAESSLVFEDAWSNCGNTTGSLVTLLTGRLPTSTGVICPPDVLRGQDCYRHLPGILRRSGYRTFAATVRYYADPYELDMLQAFGEANGRRATVPRAALWLRRLLGPDGAFFLARTTERLNERVGRVLAGAPMADPFREVDSPRDSGPLDDARIASLFQFIDRRPGPFFAVVHLLGTHGPRFSPEKRTFSAGTEQTTDFQPEWLDDALLTFDGHVEEIISALDRRRLLADTLVVIFSDHGSGYRTDRRIPLIVHLPGGARAERIEGPVQLADVAPTLLDYLGVETPSWMDGTSLLRTPVGRCREIVAASGDPGPGGEGGGRQATTGGLAHLHHLDVTLCDRRYRFFAGSQRAFEVPRAHPAPSCSGCPPLGFADVAASLVARLEERGFRTFSLAALNASSPVAAVTRAEAARTLVAALHPAGFVPRPAGKPPFADLAASDPGTAWVEQAVRDRIFAGHADGTFRPGEPLSREALAIVFAKALDGDGGPPPAPADRVFLDVSRDYWAAPWIARLKEAAADVSCAPEMFCPDLPATRRDLDTVVKALVARRHPPTDLHP